MQLTILWAPSVPLLLAGLVLHAPGELRSNTVAGVAGAPAVQTQPLPSVADVPELAGLAQRWRAGANALGVPGCSVAIVKDGKLLATDAFGVRNPAGDPVDADTLFYIASCTKTFTAAALVALAEQEVVELDAPVNVYLPRFRVADDAASEQITVRELLCHRPGINSQAIVWLDAYTGEITEDRFYRWLARVEPTGQVQYTNVHFTIAGRVIEAATGKSWKDALDELLFQPAGMTRTTAYASRMYADANVALPMESGADGFVACSTRKTDRTMHAAGGTGTTARDAARWLLMQLRDGELESGPVLSVAATQLMRTRHSDSPPNGQIRRLDGFGLGWMLGTYRGRPYVTHGGGYVGTAAHLSFLPDDGLGVVVLANGSPSGQALADVVSIDIYDRLLGESGHADLLPRYIERIKAGSDSDPQPASNLVSSGQLALDGSAYAGTYTNADWGSLTLVLREGELLANMGDLEVWLVALDAGAFAAHASSGGSYTGSFVLDGESVLAIELTDADGTIRFTRAD